MKFLNLFENTFNQISSLLKNNKKVCINGLNQGERAFISGLNKRGVIIVGDLISANNYNSQLLSMGLKSQIVMRGFDTPLFVYAQDLSSIKQMICGVSKFLAGEIDFLIVNTEALFQRLPEKKNFIPIQLEKGNYFSLDYIIKQLADMGYERRPICSCQGEFSLRGDILDIFAVGEENPIRFDFFDEVLERIYSFNLDTMTKIADLDKALIVPQSIFTNLNYELIKTKLDESFQQNDLFGGDLYNSVMSSFERDYKNMNLSFILPFLNFNQNITSLLKTDIFIDEPKKVLQSIESLKQSFESDVEKLIFEKKLLNEHKSFYYNENLLNSINSFCAFENINSKSLNYDVNIKLNSSPVKRYIFDFNSLVEDLIMFTNGGYRLVLYAGDKSTAENLSKNLMQRGVKILNEYNFLLGECGVLVVQEYLYSSVKIFDSHIMLFATNDLVKKNEKTILKKKKSLFLPKIDDYVVHDFHGVGKCIDIVRLKLGDSEKDYFIIEYANGDKIYIPTENADSISAYVGGDAVPKLNKLGGLEFSKIKERAKKSIAELAIDLLELYKERESAKGFVFEEDSYLQQEFENCFEFEETPDQLEAISQIKSDMCSQKVMDRLICGDVGYGKTEVALRAIYKAILSGKQVAFLAPTTILSDQHYKTCVKRFKDFMVNIEVLNRLVPASKQKNVLENLSKGKVDLLIGTHRLLGEDVKFKDLGLLVLDEEQRFGVADKEKIKNLKKNIDVLTLSATPIPRTLHMSLSGIRDISLIETPPKNRICVQTFVCEFDEKIIIDACKRELSRNGQVLMVYNRVETIYDFVNYIKNLLPDVNVGVAHGQMPANILENSVLKLYNGEYQILVATTLIENGIDLPNANTLIVIDADKLGLSSLYQLKGRVGRSNRVAYAYFTYNKNKNLTEDAYKRLNAICEFSSLGSGFKIALRDLEIRGAGSILGKQQHGHIEKVGYDLYCRLLDEAVNDIKGEKQKMSREIKMDIDVNAYISNEYIPDENLRISYYSQISSIANVTQANQIYENVNNSFGQPNEEFVNLIIIALIKNKLSKHNVKRVVINNQDCRFYLYKEENVIDEYLSSIIKASGNSVLKFETLPIIEFKLVAPTLKKCNFILNLLYPDEKFAFDC